MSKPLQISARTWTGKDKIERMLVETEGRRITKVIPVSQNSNFHDTLVFPDDNLLIPGLHDAHLHLLMGGYRLGWVDFSGVKTVEEFQQKLSDYIQHKKIEKGEWIQGAHLNEVYLQVTRLDIDKVCLDIPVFINSHDEHSAVVNSAALLAAKIDGGTKNPEGGKFERDSSGKLSGVLRETAAHYVKKFIPQSSNENARTALLEAQQLAFSLGITASSASVREDELPHYLSFAESSDQKIRTNIWKVSVNFDFEQDKFERQSSDKFRFATFKGFTDGALGSRTAAFWQTYADDSNNNGMALVREGPLARFIRSAHKENYQIALHAIGDRANSICLDAFEMASASGKGPELRPRIEHVQHLQEKDIPRFARLGVIASMQPIHCTADMFFCEKRLGQERLKFSYAWKSLLDAGATLAFGSDWPIETLDPLKGIHAAVTRQNEKNQPESGWQSQECISVEEALKAYTMGSAYAANWEENIGTIETGKFADMTVLSKNIFEISTQEILRTKALMTMVNGEIVYQSNDF